MGIFLVTIILLFLFWPTIKRYAHRYMARKAEDFLRQATGMPPRDKHGSSGRGRQRRPAGGSTHRERGRRRDAEEPLIPKEYAEDVEFTETVSYSETTIDSGNPRDAKRTAAESQVSDAEWVDIKSPGRK